MNHADHLEGFTELLEATGVAFTFGDATFNGVLKTLEPKPQAYDLTPGDDVAVQVSLLSADAPEGLARVGQSFTGLNGAAYRVTRVRPVGTSGVLRLECVETYSS